MDDNDPKSSSENAPEAHSFRRRGGSSYWIELLEFHNCLASMQQHARIRGSLDGRLKRCVAAKRRYVPKTVIVMPRSSRGLIGANLSVKAL